MASQKAPDPCDDFGRFIVMHRNILPRDIRNISPVVELMFCQHHANFPPMLDPSKNAGTDTQANSKGILNRGNPLSASGSMRDKS
jgi:hypothetical protein